MSFVKQLPRIKKKIEEERAKVVGRKKKIHDGGLGDIKGDKISIVASDGEFTAVAAMGTVCRVADTAQAIAEYARVLRKGGQAIFVCWSMSARELQGKQFYVPDVEFMKELKKHFEILSKERVFEGAARELFIFTAKKK